MSPEKNSLSLVFETALPETVFGPFPTDDFGLLYFFGDFCSCGSPGRQKGRCSAPWCPATANHRNTIENGLWHVVHSVHLGNGRNTVSRVLFRRRELTKFYGKLGEFGGKLGEFAFAHK